MQTNRIDLPLALTIFALSIFGWMMIASLSGPASYTVNINNGIDCSLDSVNCNSIYMWRHFWHMVLGIAICIGTLFIPYGFWKKSSPILFGITIAMLIIVLISNYGAKLGTFAQSWINIPGLPVFQPSEFAKIVLILYLANWMSKRSEQIRTIKEGLFPFAVLTSIIILPVIRQPDYGSALVIAIIAASIFYLAGAKIYHILLGGTIVVVLAAVIINGVLDDKTKEHLLKRLFPPEHSELKEGFQPRQALIAVGTGGLTGVGYNSSRQKHRWLPEVESDYIFAGTAEELGFIRIIWVIGAYLFIAYRGFIIAKNAPDRFGRLTAVGITIAIVSQAFVHIAINLDIFPVTGITLPLISRGGSSLIVTLFSLGILLNISKNVLPETAHLTHRRRIRRPHYPQPRYYR